MSGKEEIKTLRKKMINFSENTNNSFKKKIIYKNKIINSKNIKIDNNEDFICEYSNELLNENNKLSGKIHPFINPVPFFTVKNDNPKNILTRGTFFKNLKTQQILNNKENNKENNIVSTLQKEDLKEKYTKINNKDLNKSNINNYFRAYSPFLYKKQKKIFNSQNFDTNINNINNTSFLNYEKMLKDKSKLIKTFDRNKKSNSKPILSCKNNYRIKNHLYYSTDNCFSNDIVRENEEKIKNKKLRLIKLFLGQKINSATMKIEILQSFKKNKNLNSIKKQIEYSKIYCKNDLQRLKDKYSHNINEHLKQIKYLKMRLLRTEELFLTIDKHKEIINKEDLKFKIKKMDLIEKIISLQKLKNNFLNPDSTNDTYRIEDSLEEKTINDMSINDFSLLKDTPGIGGLGGVEGIEGIGINNSYNNISPFNEEIKIKKIKHEISIFPAKFIKEKAVKKNKVI